MRYHVTQMTSEAAMKHTRRVIGIADKPEVGIGWTPYNFYVTDRAVSAWATHTEVEFESKRIADRLTAPVWGPWHDGIRSAWMDVKPRPLGDHWSHVLKVDGLTVTCTTCNEVLEATK